MCTIVGRGEGALKFFSPSGAACSMRRLTLVLHSPGVVYSSLPLLFCRSTNERDVAALARAACAFVPQKCRGLQGSLHLRPPIFHGGRHLRSLPTRLSSPFSPDWKSPHWRCLLHACSACSYFAVEPFGGGELVMVHYEGAPVVRRPCASALSLGMIFARLAS